MRYYEAANISLRYFLEEGSGQCPRKICLHSKRYIDDLTAKAVWGEEGGGRARGQGRGGKTSPSRKHSTLIKVDNNN